MAGGASSLKPTKTIKFLFRRYPSVGNLKHQISVLRVGGEIERKGK